MNHIYYAIDPVSQELYHHGILGQKWGVRRYQNEDGSWTQEGLDRRRNPYINKKKIYVERTKGPLVSFDYTTGSININAKLKFNKNGTVQKNKILQNDDGTLTKKGTDICFKSKKVWSDGELTDTGKQYLLNDKCKKPLKGYDSALQSWNDRTYLDDTHSYLTKPGMELYEAANSDSYNNVYSGKKQSKNAIKRLLDENYKKTDKMSLEDLVDLQCDIEQSLCNKDKLFTKKGRDNIDLLNFTTKMYQFNVPPEHPSSNELNTYSNRKIKRTSDEWMRIYDRTKNIY